MTHHQRDHYEVSAAPSNSSVDLTSALTRSLRILRYRKKILISTICLHLFIGAIYFTCVTRKFQSTAKLLIIKQSQDQLSTVGDHESSDNTMATHRELLVSPVVLEAAIRNLAPIHRVDFQGKIPSQWVDTIGNNLSAKITRKTNIIDVSYRSRHPESAAAVVQAVINSYLAFVEQNHQGMTGTRIEELLAKEREINQKLMHKQQEFLENGRRVGQLAIGSEDNVVEPQIQRALRLNESLQDTRERLLELKASLQAVDDSLARGEDINQHLVAVESMVGRQMLLSTLGLSNDDMRVLSDQKKKLLAAQKELESLSVYYGPNHPRMIELQSEINSSRSFLVDYRSNFGQRIENSGNEHLGPIVRNLILQSVRQTEQKEQEFARAFEVARLDASNHSGQLIHHRMLEREVLQLEAEKTRLQESISIIDRRQTQAPLQATVVREPLPDRRPISPNLRFTLFLSISSGLILGGLIVYVQDMLDDRFNSPEEISMQLGVPILAMVRKLDSLSGEGLATVHTHTLPTSAETEAFRTLRTAITLNNDVCDRILVSSSEPGDGKTTISANLAVAFAQAGHRTLVIDADLRRPGFSTLLELKGRPGVADVLNSDRPPASTAPEWVHKTEAEGLDVLPVGLRRPNPAELLSNRTFVELLAWADSVYDRVIVDCPPVLAVSDAQIVGQLVDGAILVVRPEKNHRRSVIRAVESFHSAGCRLLGVVANGLSDEARGYGYGYGYGYGDEYGHEPDYLHEVATDTSPREAHGDASISPTAPSTYSTNLEQIKPRKAA